jgi:prephenate dehydratase
MYHAVMYDAAYQGTRGANSEDAAIDLLTKDAKLFPRETFQDVFNAVAGGEARYGVIPIENTLAGSIHENYDLLFEHEDLKIVGETVRHILFALIAPPGVALGQLRRALSHPKALAQCEQFFRKHPQIQPVPVYDTAGAVERVTREGLNDAAAVATRRAAEVYGGVVLAESIQDHSENYTRFLLITPSKSPEPPAKSGDYKTTIVFSVGNAPGALYHSLRPFAERRIDLAKIESRPLRGSPFEYLFYLDVIGRADSKPLADALNELRAQAKTVRVLGTYPRFHPAARS